MSITDITVYEFQPLWLTIDRIGPFQGTPYEIDFTDAKDKPCNMFLLMSENGRGKTTILEIIACFIGLLDQEAPKKFGQEELDEGEGRAQLDILTRIHWQGRDHRIVLSILGGEIGDKTVLKAWSAEDMEKYGASSWHRTGFRRRAPGRLEPINRHDELVLDIVSVIQDSRHFYPEGFESSTLSLPTALYFPAYRDIPEIRDLERAIVQPEHWGYKALHSFSAHGTHWTASLDNLLVWLKWLDNGSFERALKIVNDVVFKEYPDKYLKGIRRNPPEAVVKSGAQEHRLDRLSSGEKNLTQLFLRIGAHLTRNTWVLADELDVHLHVRWQHKVLNQMKELVRRQPGTTLIAATHSVEILTAFPIDIKEKGLVKGGWIIEEKLH